MNFSHFHVEPESLLYQWFNYPAGEMQVRLTEDGVRSARTADRLSITCNYANPNAFMQLCLLVNAIRGVTKSGCHIFLVLPYLPYSRADRRFLEGDCDGLQAFCSLLRTLPVDTIATLDVHSPACHNYLEVADVSPLPFIENAIARFAALRGVKGVTVLFPDEGAAQRYILPPGIGSNVEMIDVQVLHCTKKRDAESGKLLGFNVPSPEDFRYSNAIIVDDICDGGGTFLGIAMALKRHRDNLALYVTHGIFSKGFDELALKFSRIFSTDSMGIERSSSDVHTFECGPLIYQALRNAK